MRFAVAAEFNCSSGVYLCRWFIILIVTILQDPNCLISLGKGCARSQGKSARVRYVVVLALAALVYLFTYVHSSIADV